MEESSSKLLEAEQRLQEERQRAVLLEQHLEKMRLEPCRTSVSQKVARNKPGTSPGAAQPQEQASVGSSACLCCEGLLVPRCQPGSQRVGA